MGQYKVAYDEKAGSLNMNISGHFTEEDGINYMNDFVEMSSKYQTTETYLTLDCGLLFIYPCYVIEALHEVFKVYKDLGYKLVRFKVFKAQKEMARKFIELCNIVGLEHDVFEVDRY